MIHYLAYGSNMHPLRLRERVPSARAVATVVLPGWDLRFHKVGQDGSAKCDIVAAAPGEVVHAVVYALRQAEREALDLAEGLGRGYDEDRLVLNGGLEVFCYRAAPDHIDPALRPFRWYRDYVCSGARYHGLPAAYVERLEAVAVIDDHQVSRSRRHEAVLEALVTQAPG